VICALPRSISDPISVAFQSQRPNQQISTNNFQQRPQISINNLSTRILCPVTVEPDIPATSTTTTTVNTFTVQADIELKKEEDLIADEAEELSLGKLLLRFVATLKFYRAFLGFEQA